MCKARGMNTPPCNRTHHLLVCRAAPEVTMTYNPKTGCPPMVILHIPDSFENLLRVLLKPKTKES